MKKPLVLRLNEAKKQIISSVNTILGEQELPCYLIEPIIADLHRQINAGAAKEYEKAKNEFTTEDTGENVDE